MSTMIRIDDETKRDLLLLTVLEDKKSMAKMVRELLDFYKEHKEECNDEGLQTPFEITGTPVGK